MKNEDRKQCYTKPQQKKRARLEVVRNVLGDNHWCVSVWGS